VATTNANSIFNTNDFVTPVIPTTSIHPSQSGAGLTLGEFQQVYQPTWSMAGGNINIQASQNIARYTHNDDELTIDSSRQMPTNWLYRRGHVDPSTGLFADNGGVDRVTDTSTSTTWWVDFSNFFQGVGTLGGGNVALKASKDVINVDAVAPTNARMAGRDPSTGKNLAPDETRLLEWGGGDVTIQAGSDISGGVYYVESSAQATPSRPTQQELPHPPRLQGKSLWAHPLGFRPRYLSANPVSMWSHSAISSWALSPTPS
jgi:hypothetical protein